MNEIITIKGTGADLLARKTDQRIKQEKLANRAPFTDCISKINNCQEDNSKNWIL